MPKFPLGKVYVSVMVEEQALTDQGAKFRAEISFEESVRIRHVIIGTLPCVSITSLNQIRTHMWGQMPIPTR